jgi:Ca-activated chloride channel family protein
MPGKETTVNPTILTDDEILRLPGPEADAGFGALSTPRGALPLTALDVAAHVDGLFTEMTLTQTFVNSTDEVLEATYIFPLPDRAAVTAFRMEVAGRVVEAELKERAQARKEYDQAIAKGHRAAIAEEDRPGVFTLRVGNLPPGETATVKLTLCGPLLYDSGEATFRFPLVVAPRYIPGVPLSEESVGDGVAPDTNAVPDASRISPPVLLPGYPNPVRLGIAVDVANTSDWPNFRTSLPVKVTRTATGHQICVEPGERLYRDFILRYPVGAGSVQSSLVLKPDADGKNGTFALTLLPPLAQSQAMKPRAVVFLLDRSGSMSGWKMVAARRALARMVETLTERDHFSILAFDDRVETPRHFEGERLVPATMARRSQAADFLLEIEARGGTEMLYPLEQAVAELNKQRAGDRILVLITDGQVGNEDQILQRLGKKLGELRIYTLGIDTAVNEAFLRRLATLGGGSCDLVESEARLEGVMDKVQRRIGTPVLTGLGIDGAELRIETVVPARLPDLFAGVPLIVTGRYRGVAERAVTVKGTDEAGRPWTQTLQGRTSRNAAIMNVWARGYLRTLEDAYVTREGDPRLLENQIVEVSLKYGALCRFTAFVAVDRAEVVNQGGTQHRILQPVEAPAGWEMFDREHEAAAMLLGMTDCAKAAPTMSGFIGRAPDSLLQELTDTQQDSLGSDFDDDVESVESNLSGFEGMSREEIKGRLTTPPPAASGSAQKKERVRYRGLSGRNADEGQSANDLAAYRRRAAEKLAQMQERQAADGFDVATELLILLRWLDDILEDLRSINAPKGDLLPLLRLADSLRLNTDRSEDELLWKQALEALLTFVTIAWPVPGNKPRKRWSFWK